MKELLKDYFSGLELEILDNNKPGRDSNKNYYVGVTFEYIVDYVLESKCSPIEVAKALIELRREEIVTPAPCNNINKIVFGNLEVYYDKLWSRFNFNKDNLLPEDHYRDLIAEDARRLNKEYFSKIQ